MRLKPILMMFAALALSGCVAAAVVGTAVDVTTTAVETTVDVTSSVVTGTVDLVTGSDEDEEN